MMDKIIIKKRIRPRSLRGLAPALLVAVVVLLAGAFPVMSSDADLYTANWLKQTNYSITVGNAGSWDEKGVGVSCVINDGGTLKMWYTGYNNSDVFRIGYAYSTDNGANWTKLNPNTADGYVLPVGGVGKFDEKGVGSPCVIKVGANDYRMWYTGYKLMDSARLPQIGYAYSSNGTSWNRGNNAEPVLQAGTGAAWDNKGAHSCWVIYDTSDSKFKMWYTGRTGDTLIGNSAIGYAETANTTGDTGWTKLSNTGGPVFSAGATGSWDQSGVAVACVLKANSKFTMWYTGYSGLSFKAGGSIASAIGVAQSADGKTDWTRNVKPVVTTGTDWNVGSVGAPRVLEASSTKLVMWYSGFSAGLTPRIGAATVDTTQFNGTAKLQGSDRPSPTGYMTVPLTLKLYDPTVTLNMYNIALQPGQSVEVEGVTYSYVAPMFTFTTTPVSHNPAPSSRTVSFSVNVPSGNYKITLHTPSALTTLKTWTITAPDETLHMGTLIEGNPNEDEQIAIGDYTLLLNDYLATPNPPNEAKWNGGRCDLDRDGQVRGVDFSILSMNYTQTAPQPA